MYAHIRCLTGVLIVPENRERAQSLYAQWVPWMNVFLLARRFARSRARRHRNMMTARNTSNIQGRIMMISSPVLRYATALLPLLFGAQAQYLWIELQSRCIFHTRCLPCSSEHRSSSQNTSIHSVCPNTPVNRRLVLFVSPQCSAQVGSYRLGPVMAEAHALLQPRAWDMNTLLAPVWLQSLGTLLRINATVRILVDFCRTELVSCTSIFGARL